MTSTSAEVELTEREFIPSGVGFAPDLFAAQTALVNGGTSGIGFRVAEILALCGVQNLVIAARTESDGAQTRDHLLALAPAACVEFVRTDYLNAADVANLFKTVDERFGRLDVFVHTVITSAGPRPFAGTERWYWEKVVNALFLSFVDCASCAAPLMKRGGGGSIVSIASDALRVATPGESIIGGAMAANAMFAKVLAIEEGRNGIRVNVVSPTITRDTRGYEKAMQGGFTSPRPNSEPAWACRRPLRSRTRSRSLPADCRRRPPARS